MTPSPKSQLTPLLVIIEIVVAAVVVTLIVIGAIRLPETIGVACVAAGLVGLVIQATTLPVVLLLHHMVTRQAASQTEGTSIASNRHMEQLLGQLHQNSMLSDIAKRVLFREQELNLLRRAIEDDIAHGEYNAGLTLCDDMANVFGRREEAEAFRTRILQAGHDAYESKVHHSMEQFDRILAVRDWAAAHREAASIRRLYPSHELVQELDRRIMHARDQHKHELETHFLEAANREDVEQAMSLLKELDRYLSREEAGRLAQAAQRVVSKHRDNLSMQFKLAVSEHRWAEAAQVGDHIIAEYPNTKMADEVRSMLEVLRSRAAQAPVAVH